MATRDDVERVLAHVNRASDLEFFFDQLTSPDWVDPISEAGLFSAPPGPEVDGEFVRYPSWAASRYLARVAAKAPEKVLDVVRGLPDSGNPRVHEDITEAAAAMPVDAARQLVPQVRSWLETDRHLLLLPERALDLTRLLATRGASDEALELAQALFDVTVDPDDLFGTRVRARLRDHDFDISLAKLVGPLVAAAGARAIRLFVTILDGVLRARHEADESVGRFDDASTIWRRDVGDRSDREARFEPVLNALVDAVYDGTKLTPARDLADVFVVLNDAGATVFRRIALQVIADGDIDIPVAEVVRLVVHREALSDHSLELEYLRALAARASDIPTAERELLVDWVRIGPVSSDLLSERFGDEWADYLRLWQARRLAALGAATPQSVAVWASEVVASVDRSDLLPQRPATVATWVGPTSPLAPAEMSTSPIEEIVAYLRTWSPSGEWAAPSREGLGRSLSAAVLERPSTFAKNATSFVGLDPVYVRSLIGGLRDAVKAGSRITWDPVLELCEWVVDQEPGTLHEDWVREDRDPGWGWTWTEIARLLEQGLTKERTRIPKGLSTRTRRLVLRLVTHPDPTPESEAQYGGSNMDPSTLSLNTTRGEAAHALMRLAWWEKEVLSRAVVDASVRAAIERLLTPTIEQSLAVHSVFGRWFGTLSWLDHPWAASLIERIFPTRPEEASFWWAAWSAFIVFDRPTTSAHELLHQNYELASSRVGDDVERLYFHAGRDHAEALAAHLLAYVVWGVEGEPDRGLLVAVVGGPAATRAELVEQAGRLLRDHGDLDPEYVHRLKQLWAARRAVAEQSIDDDLRLELARFSWWCGSPALETRWWLDELRWVLAKGISLDAPFVILEAMPEAAAVDAKTAVDVVDAMSRITSEPWLIQGHRDEVAQVLVAAISSTEPEARRAAIRLIHDLGAREVANFSDLLPRGDPS